MEYHVALLKADVLDGLKTLERLEQEFSAAEAMVEKSPEDSPCMIAPQLGTKYSLKSFPV